jgi:hypothetical protein
VIPAVDETPTTKWEKNIISKKLLTPVKKQQHERGYNKKAIEKIQWLYKLSMEEELPAIQKFAVHPCLQLSFS